MANTLSENLSQEAFESVMNTQSSSTETSGEETSSTLAHSGSYMKQQFLPTPGEPSLKWQVWYRMFEDHLVATGLDKVTEVRKLAILRSSLGTEGYRICSELCTRDSSYNDTIQQLESRFAPKQSVICARANFNRRIQSHHENFLEFVTSLRALAAKCNYPDSIRDELIRDRFVAGCSTDRLRERLLLQDDTLTLDQALNIAQTFERATSEASAVSNRQPTTDSIQALRGKYSSKQNQSRSNSRGRSPERNRFSQSPRRPTAHLTQSTQFRSKACYTCGKQYSRDHKCPAKNRNCTYCGKTGHFEAVCYSKHSTRREPSSPQPRFRKSSYSRIKVISAISKQANGSLKYITCRIAYKPVNLLVDSGAKVSLLNVSFLNTLRYQPQLYPSTVKLTTYTGSPVQVLGEVRLRVNHNSTELSSFPFQVVKHGGNLMGIDLFDALGLRITESDSDRTIATLSFPKNATNPILAKYPNITKITAGKIVKRFVHEPTINPQVQPITEAQRRVPLVYSEKVIAELKRMEKEQVLEKIDSSPWVSNMVIAPKPNNNIRICADLRNANTAVIPDKYPLPTIDELSQFFAGSTVFSKIDLKWGYLQVPLSKECRYLTAMITPIGLYQWTRIPFGLCSAPSAFQKIIEKIIEGCPRTKNLLDDIIVSGRDQAEHDRNLDMVLRRLSEYNATINVEKCQFSLQRVQFVGHTISAEGVRPLQSNVDALLKIPPPTNTKEVHSFLSTANYYMKFVPNFSHITEPLRAMLKKDAEFYWNEQTQEAFDKIKREIASSRVLAHFDINCQTIVSTDASGIALGAVLSQIQRGQEVPIAFASRALQPNERAYSVGEREALACIWACEHWHYYLYGTLHTPYRSFFFNNTFIWLIQRKKTYATTTLVR